MIGKYGKERRERERREKNWAHKTLFIIKNMEYNGNKVLIKGYSNEGG